MNKINVLCLHGIGGKDDRQSKTDWKTDWKDAIESKAKNVNISFPVFDHFFDEQQAGIIDYWKFLKDIFFTKDHG
ncbi:hypothetical protein [Chryseobacterium sp. JUb7]|uniref:hypothetical protein n=1 Tax=Chryseobacterium sp. JUb7 TaxID=2940599 RepID=UPI002168B6A4|nr:hypothetical protein [Chryseobacterium sp. JUb7]MCS3530484.1 hypothetical protein [Chryseobacterium sp. JUb7]